MRSKDIKLCACSSKKRFEQCCGPVLTGQTHAKTPEKLMRSRFSAYKLGGYGQYLHDTWAPSFRSNIDPVRLNTADVDWIRLEVNSKSQSGNCAQVSFSAHYKDERGDECIMQETSSFIRDSGIWYYTTGIVTDSSDS